MKTDVCIRIIALGTSTALALSMSGALAQDSRAYVDQTGAANTALIEQGGAGSHRAGSASAVRMQQQGDFNSLRLGQSGVANHFGTSGVGFDQVGNHNRATVTQASSFSYINQVQQTATGATAGTANRLTIEQVATNGNFSAASGPGNQARFGNVVSTVSQTNTGGADNVVTIRQDRDTNGGPGGFGANVIAAANVGGNVADRPARLGGGVFQTGHANEVDLSQTGDRNLIREVTQDGVNNLARLFQNGRFNGAGTVSGASAASGAANGMVQQTGDDNVVDVRMTGDLNQFGFTQAGNDNSATGTIVGASNAVGSLQIGNDNVLSFTVTGSDNNVGFDQQGSDNLATLNTIGDGNGNGLSFTGDALTAAGTLASGLIQQRGDGNLATLVATGDGNAFAFLQDGDLNTITGSQTGNGHQAAVVQAGASSVASFTQVGTANTVGIVQ